MAGKHLGLGVLECRWFKDGNTSVRPLFDTLADLHAKNPNAYHFEMFADARSFREVALRVAGSRSIRTLYIATHGDEAGLGGANHGTSISRTVIANTLDKLSNQWGGSLEGVFFGSCGFGQRRNFAFLMSPLSAPKIAVSWLAGYERTINWIDTAAVDLFFWNAYFRARGSVLERIRTVANRIEIFMPGAHKELGLQIYIRADKRKTPEATTQPLLGVG